MVVELDANNTHSVAKFGFAAIATVSHMQKRKQREDDAVRGGSKKVVLEAAEGTERFGREVVEDDQNDSENSGVIPAQPYPFFDYTDYSQEKDSDPFILLAPPGKVPAFPAKMHAILARPEFSDIVAWLPHGRSWRIRKMREFENSVIPMFFEHTKLTSFIRQANGWGFRRITQGRDCNSYYHERFLRGIPHLSKKMKRPGVSEKRPVLAEHEPDFYKISEIHPIPLKAPDDSIMLQCTIEGGPKARVPVEPNYDSCNSACVSAPALTQKSPEQILNSLVSSTPSFTPIRNLDPPLQFGFNNSAAQYSSLTHTSRWLPPLLFPYPFATPTQMAEHSDVNKQSLSSTPATASLLSRPAPMPVSAFTLTAPQAPFFDPTTTIDRSLLSQQKALLYLKSQASSQHEGSRSQLSIILEANKIKSNEQYAAGFAAATLLAQQRLQSMIASGLPSKSFLF